MKLTRRQMVEIFLIMLTYGSATASFVEKNIPAAVVGMSTASFMFWQFIEYMFEDNERDDARKEREKERDEFRKLMDKHTRTMELIGYDIKTMTGLTGVFPARFEAPEPRMQLANHVPTESEVVQPIVAEHRGPVDKVVRDIIEEILDDVCGEDTSEERRHDDQGRDVQIKSKTSANAFNHARDAEQMIEARINMESELRKRSGWTA